MLHFHLVEKYSGSRYARDLHQTPQNQVSKSVTSENYIVVIGVLHRYFLPSMMNAKLLE